MTNSGIREKGDYKFQSITYTLSSQYCFLASIKNNEKILDAFLN